MAMMAGTAYRMRSLWIGSVPRAVACFVLVIAISFLQKSVAKVRKKVGIPLMLLLIFYKRCYLCSFADSG